MNRSGVWCKSGPRVFLGLSVLLHLIVYSYYLYPAVYLTKSAIETDDAYAYMQKAESIGQRVTPFYRQLEEQSASSKIDEWTKNRYDGRLFCNYSPLHSLGLLGLKQITPTWEIAYAASVILGGLLLVFSFGYLALAWFGPWASGLYFLFFTSLKYPGAGWQYIVPSNIALGFSALAWALTIHSGLWPVITLLTVLAIFTHPIGFAYAGITILLFAYSSLGKEVKNWPGLTVLTMGTLASKAFASAILVTNVNCSFGSKLGYSYENIDLAVRSLLQWNNQWKSGFTLTFLLAAFGVWGLSSVRRNQSLLLLVCLILAYILSVFYIVPGYPGELSLRLLLPLGLFSSILFASGTVSIFGWLKRSSTPIWILLLLAVGLGLDRMALVKAGLLENKGKWENLYFWRNVIYKSPDIFWDSAQIKDWNLTYGDKYDLAFEHETTLYFYLANKLRAKQIFFIPFHPDQVKTSFRAVRSPIQPRLLNGSPVGIEYSISKISLELENRDPHESLVTISSNQESKTVSIAARSNLMLEVQAQGGLLWVSSKNTVVLKGIRTSKEQSTHWPWDAKVHLVQDNKKTSIQFNQDQCSFTCRPKRVVFDGGYSLILEQQ